MKSSSYAIAAAVLLAAVSMVHAPNARAASSASTAVGSCLGSSSASDANLRKRPLGMRNEGTTSAFISCAAQYGYNASGVADAVLIATNTNAQAVDLTCTLVDGVLSLVFYYPKTVSIPANDAAQIVWLPSDNGGTSFTGYENFSCNVPPGVEINLVGFDYESTAP